MVQTLRASPADPLLADDLQHLGEAFAPIAADELGVLIDDEEAEAAVSVPARRPPGKV